MPEHTPIPVPSLPEGTANEVKLTPEQEEKLLKVLEHFGKDDFRVPDEEKGELTEDERFWLTNECILRFLRATKWVLPTTIHRLEETLKWRREYGIYDHRFTPEHVEPEAVTGKEIAFGYDTHRRPALYMFPSRQNTTESPRQLQFAVWMLERSIDLMGPGVECLDLLINFADRAKNPSIGTARSMLHILQSHYPERLGLALIINIPFFVNAFFRIIMPFVDPITRNKVKFNPDIFADGHMTKDMVMAGSWGGEREFEYKHEDYWKALVGMCDERRNAQKERWRQLGGKVGISEWDIKTGAAGTTTEVSAAPTQAVDEEKRVVLPSITVEEIASPVPAVAA